MAIYVNEAKILFLSFSFSLSLSISILDTAAGDVAADDAAVLGPYARQVEIIRMTLRAQISRHDASLVRIGSVDSFPGRERDEVILFSSVHSNAIEELGLLHNPRRLCVDISYTHRTLIVIGDARVPRASNHWSELANSSRARDWLLQAPAVLDSLDATRTSIRALYS